MASITACPCGSGDYVHCCGPFHAGAVVAPTAEALMRSRYSAFVLGRSDYLLASWHPRTRPASLALEAGVQWLGLEVRAQQSTGAESATVEFVARSRVGGGRAQRLHEISRFLHEDGRWFYLDGDIR